MPVSEKTEPEIRLVVFDLGRVLLRIVDDWDHAARRADRPDLLGLTGDLSTPAARGQHQPLADLFDRFETGRIQPDAFFTQAQAITGHPTGCVQRVMDAVLIETFPGAVALLNRLATVPVKTACLSNTNARHWQLFTDPADPSYLPLDKLDYAWGSQILGLAKPDPAIYRRVEELTEVKPADILFFDDIPENIDAARRSGWHAELVSRDTDNPIPAVETTLAAYGVLPPLL